MTTAVPLLEIRLLGGTTVRRRDRSPVATADWPPGKSLDLLRVLAVHAGRPVRTRQLADWLWPELPSYRATSGLLTAATQVRRTLRDDCVGRGPHTMTLRHAWVDVIMVRGLLQAGREAMADDRPRDVVARTRSMEGLYHGDFHADDDTSDWALAVRNHLASGRLRLLEDAGTSCVALGEHREALVYANAVLRRDPVAETAYRTKMQAHVELGESALALRAFERYRRRFDDNDDGEPTPEMVALRKRLLRGH